MFHLIERCVPSASTYSGDIDFVFSLIFWIVGFWFLLAEVVFFWLILRFRKRDGVQGAVHHRRAEAARSTGSTGRTWLVLVFDVVILVAAVRVWYDVKQDLPPAERDRARRRAAVGLELRAPRPRRAARHAPTTSRRSTSCTSQVGTLYHFKLESRDVLHSFSVPVFRLKQDAIPGRVITGWFEADQDRQLRHPVRGDLRHRPRADAGAHRDRDAGAARRLDGEPVRPSPSRPSTRRARRRSSAMAHPAETHPRPRTARTTTTEPGWVSKYLFSTDHKMIAMQYMFTGMAHGADRRLLRLRVPHADGLPRHATCPVFGLVTPNEYNALITNHGAIMIFWVAMPVLIAAFGNFLIPLMIGCDDMVFPRINRLSLPDLPALGGRAARARSSCRAAASAAPGRSTRRSRRRPSTTSRRSARRSSCVAVALEFVAFLLGGINFVTTAMNSRAPGMKLYDIPIVVWMIVIASILFMASVGPLIAGAVMLFFDQKLGTAFFDPDRGGDPILWQHLFWFFGHPEVYVVLLPALGIVAEIITVFSRKKLFAYKTVLYTAFGTGVLSLHGLGAPPVHRRHRPAHGEHLHGHDAADLGADRRDDVRLHRHALRRLDHAHDADAVGARLHRRVPDRRRDRASSSARAARTSTCTTPTSCSPTSTTRSSRSRSSGPSRASRSGSRRCSGG